MSTRYELSVWDNTRGDHVKKLWDATEADYEKLLEQYDDEPEFEVVIDKEWLEEDDDDEC